MLRIDTERSEHREALRDALVLGVTLYDLGDVDHADFAAKAKLLRGSISEYAPGSVRVLVRANLGRAAMLEEAISAFREDAKTEWIALVADPEFSLPELEWDPARLYDRLAEELDVLESLADRGGIASYGVASRALTAAKEDPEALALEPLVRGWGSAPLHDHVEWDPTSLATARPANRRHFGWIEFPFNLYESEAATEPNQVVGAETGTLLEAAARFGLATIARRPLDALTEDGLRRLVAYPDHHRLDLDETVKRTLETALAAEREAGLPDEAPKWAHRLRDQLRHVVDPEQWKEILRRRIEPDLGHAMSSAADSPERARYFDAMSALVMAVRLWLEKSAAERNERLRCRIVEAAPTFARRRHEMDRDLALLALRTYRSVPGLDHVLFGMRSPRYVAALAAAQARFADEAPLASEELENVLFAAHASLHPHTEPHSPKGTA